MRNIVVENSLYGGFFHKDKEGNKKLNGKTIIVEQLSLYRGSLQRGFTVPSYDDLCDNVGNKDLNENIEQRITTH